MIDIYQQIREEVLDDAARYPNELILIEDSDRKLTVCDNFDFWSTIFDICSPDQITEEWLTDRTFVTSSVQSLPVRINIRKITEWIAETIDPNLLLTLQKIVYVNDTEADAEELPQLHPDFATLLDEHDLPVDLLGTFWYRHQTLVIHLGNIVNECMACHTGLPVINREILKTVAHEIRHLAQANAYLPASVIPRDRDDFQMEADAEDYAERITAGKIPAVACLT